MSVSWILFRETISTTMVFTKKLRSGVRSGTITTTIRMWQSPRVTAGKRYRFEDGNILVTSIREIGIHDITERMATESGFAGRADLLKTAMHGKGRRFFFIRFRFEPGAV